MLAPLYVWYLVISFIWSMRMMNAMVTANPGLLTPLQPPRIASAAPAAPASADDLPED